MRGQAFVSFESKEAAAQAVKEVKGFPLYAKPMVSIWLTLDTPDELMLFIATFVCQNSIGLCDGEDGAE